MVTPIRRRLFFFVLFFILNIFSGQDRNCFAQDKAISDSLKLVYEEGAFSPEEKLELLKQLVINEYEADQIVSYSEDLIALSLAADSQQHLFTGYLHKGNGLRLKGDLPQALNSYFDASRIAIEQNNQKDLGLVNVTIADVYSIMGNHDSSVRYYKTAWGILKAEKDTINYASALLNAGDEYFNYGKLDSALLLFKESGKLFDEVNSEIGKAYNLGNIGLVYAEKGEYEIAESNINQAVEILEKLGDYYPICVYLAYMSDIYSEKGDDLNALNFAYGSLELATQYKFKAEISDANLRLSKIQERLGNPDEALSYFKSHILFRDSVNNVSSVQEMETIRADFEISQKQL
ncbi:MAG: tetratricopeptide repeat protein, partial [Saprospiraceae bacterium]|nr:tetratricopeptide repeat protein [Saprospiraceae bacterium]